MNDFNPKEIEYDGKVMLNKHVVFIYRELCREYENSTLFFA